MVSSKRLYNWYIALVAVGGNVFYGYDNAIFNAMQSSQNWLDWFDLDITRDSNLIGLINTMYFVGSIVAGFFFAGPVSDYLGRRFAMHVGYLLIIVSIFMQAFAPRGNLGCFIGGRILTGIGQGIALTAGPVYMGEVAPSEIRGRLMVFIQLFYSVGSFLTYWVNYGCSMHRATLGNWDWRLVIIVELIMPATLMAMLPWQPESPRWYLQKNNNIPAARKALLSIRDTEQEVDREIAAIVHALAAKRRHSTASSLARGKRSDNMFRRYLSLFRDASIRRRLILACILNIGQQLTGQGSLNSYSTAIYRHVWQSTTTINLVNALNATFGVPFTLNALWTADRFGRRTILMFGAASMAVCMLLVPVIYLTTPFTAAGYKERPVGIAIVFLLYMVNAFFKPTWGPTTWTWTSEVFPMHVRAQGVGMCSQMQNVANMIFQQFFPTFLNNAGLRSIFFFMAVNIVLIFYVYFLIPETKQVPLEQMDALFGKVDTRTSRDSNVLGRLESQIGAGPIPEGRNHEDEHELADTRP